MMKRQPPGVDTNLVNQQAPLRHPEAELLRLYGSHSLAFFGLAEDVEHFLAPGGQGVINYRLVNRIAVVLGDPLCAPQAVEEVTRSFLAFCRARRWHVAVYQTHPTHLAIYRALQLPVFKMGEEAMLFPQTFTLQGAALANVRTSCRRAEREGVSIQWYEGAPPSVVMQQLACVSAAWLESKGGRQAEETGFSTGRLDEILMSAQHADQVAALDMPSSEVLPAPSLVTGVALTGSGQVCAFVTFTPIYGAMRDEAGVQQNCGWALDLMRRSPQAPPGVMELLLVRAMERFRTRGAQRVSLGLVALADTRQEMASVERQLASFVISRMGASRHRQTLLAFKQKFAPCWESRYLVISSRLAFPQIALAVLRLRHYSGRGLVRLLTRRNSACWQFVRYCLVGGVNTIIDVAVLNALLWRFPTHNVHLLVVENSVAYASGVVSSFFLNKYWTFRRKQRPTRREAGRFLFSVALELVSSNSLLWLTGMALSPFMANVTVWGNASKLLAVAANAVLSYLLMRFWIFACDTPDRAIPPRLSPADRGGIRKLLNRRERNVS